MVCSLVLVAFDNRYMAPSFKPQASHDSRCSLWTAASVYDLPTPKVGTLPYALLETASKDLIQLFAKRSKP